MKERKGAPSPKASGYKRPPPGGADGKAAKKFRPDKGSHAPQKFEQPAERLSKKERKQQSRERKARTNKNFSLIQEVVGLWETLRRHDTSPERRSELVSTILKKIDGRAGELAGSHAASRVVQAVVKHGTPAERAAVQKQLEPTLLPLAKSPYGRFVVSKLIDLAPKDGLQVFLKAFKGRTAELMRHPAGTHVLDDLYTAASATQRNAMAAECYGREYALFTDGTLNELAGAPTSLEDLLSAVEPAKRRAIVQHLAGAISPVIEKGLVDCQLAHRLIAEYLAAAPASLVADAVESLSGEALLHMLHTHNGAAAACMVLAYGTAKDRKKAVKAMKGHVPAAVRDEWGHLAVMTALSVVDDTAMLRKFVVSDIETDLMDLIGHKAAHRVLLQLLRPDSPRYLPPSLAALVRPPPKVAQPGFRGAGAAEDNSDDDDDEEEEEAEEEGEEGGKPAGGPLGVSKKDPSLRRQELLEGGLGAALAALCAENAGELLAAQHSADVVAEVAGGGEGGALEAAAGAAAVDAIQDAVVAAVADTIGEEDGGLLGSYFGSRAVRRLVLGAGEGDAARRFADKLWATALKGRAAAVKESHAAKVLAAVVHAGGAAGKAAAAELKEAGVKDAQAWANKFLQKAH